MGDDWLGWLYETPSSVLCSPPSRTQRPILTAAREMRAPRPHKGGKKNIKEAAGGVKPAEVLEGVLHMRSRYS